MIRFSENDIPTTLAHDAHRGSSFDPDRRANFERESYVRYIQSIIDIFAEKHNIEENPQLEADLQRFIDGYKKRKCALLSSESRHYSPMISGPANYPTRRMNKILDSIHNKREELLSYADRALNRLMRTYIYENNTVDSGDPEALEKLEKQLAKRIATQEIMKKANRIARSKKLEYEEKVAKMSELEGISEETARELMVTNYDYEKPGFQPYELSNNGAAIRRLKSRIEAVKALQQDEPVSVYWEYFSATEDAADNRIRLEFMGKPNKEIRDWLNGHAWNYSRLNEAWQRKITQNARRNARAFVEEFKDTLQKGDYLEEMT